MRLSLRWQLVATFLAINFLTLAVVSALNAWLASLRTRVSIEQQLDELIGTLSRSSYPLSDEILAQIEGFSGARFVLRSASGKTLAAGDSQFEKLDFATSPSLEKRVSLKEVVVVNTQPYFHAAVELKRPIDSFEKQTLHIFYSTSAYNAARRDAITPPLLMALGVLPLATMLLLALAHRIAAPISRLREQVARISSGDYAVAPVESATREVRELSQSVHQMASLLDAFTLQTRKTERLKALGQVNASLVHQLRNSLAGCVLAIDLHRRKCDVQGDASLEMATQQLQQMSDYVNRFVQVEKQQTAPRERIDLTALLRSVIELASPTADHLGAKLNTTISESPLHIVGDPQAIRQVMTNLVNNALEASAEYHSSGTPPEVIVRLSKRACNAILEVGDTGPGVPPEVASQLYEPFATGKREGLGLGLFVAKTATEAHAGKIETRRADGFTWFIVTLPIETQ